MTGVYIFSITSYGLMNVVFNRVSSLKGFILTEAVARQIWTQHYTPIIGERQVSYMLDKFQSVAAMQKQILEGYEYFLIYSNGKIAGYFSFLPEEEALFLSKIYVLAEMRGHGIGKRALQFIEEEARRDHLKGIRLTVNKYNTQSIQAYLKMGFKQHRAIVMDIGGGFVMDDYEMVKGLT